MKKMMLALALLSVATAAHAENGVCHGGQA